MCVCLPRQRTWLREVVVVAVHLLLLLLSARTVPLNALYLAGRRVARAGEVVVPLQTRSIAIWRVKRLGVDFVGSDLLEQTLLLPLGIADVESVAAVLGLEDTVLGRCARCRRVIVRIWVLGGRL
jgi:hypothetical protein